MLVGVCQEVWTLHYLLDLVGKEVCWFHSLEILRAFDAYYSDQQDWLYDGMLGKKLRLLGIGAHAQEFKRKSIKTLARRPRRDEFGAPVKESLKVRFYRVDRAQLRERPSDDSTPATPERMDEIVDGRQDITKIRDELEADYLKQVGPAGGTAGLSGDASETSGAATGADRAANVTDDTGDPGDADVAGIAEGLSDERTSSRGNFDF